MLTNYCYVTSIKYQQTNSEEYVASLLPNALYDGGVAVHERVIFNALGVEDFGIYNVVCCVVMI